MEALRTAVAAALVSWTALRLRWRGFAHTCGPLLAADHDAGTRGGTAIDRLTRAYQRTAVLPWSSCLSRSTALCQALRRRGTPALLRIGALPAGGGLRAHAWLELDGRVLEGEASADFPTLLPHEP